MAGEIKRITPNVFQKLLHQIVSIRPLVPFFAKYMHRMDFYWLKITGGKHTLSELAGWTIIQLTTIGAKTGQPRTMPLLAGVEGDKLAVVASSFGRKHNPGWYYNLKAHPECDISFNGHSKKYIAREIMGEEYERYWQLAVSYYAGYEKYKQRAAHRHIPVMLLESKK